MVTEMPDRMHPANNPHNNWYESKYERDFVAIKKRCYLMSVSTIYIGVENKRHVTLSRFPLQI